MSEHIGTTDLHGLTATDFGRWAFALVVVLAGSAGTGWLLQTSTPPTLQLAAAEPAMLIDLAPIPEPEPVAEPEPVVEPEPAVQPEPPPPEVAEQPYSAPPPPVEQSPPVDQPPEPEIEPFPEQAKPPSPLPVEEEESASPEPQPVPQPVVDPNLPMPMTMSPQLQQRRAETPPTPRPQPQTPRLPQPQPTGQQPRPQQSAPSTPINTISSQQWQQQVLRRLDARKVYPPASRQAGEQGAVLISFSVNSSGQIQSVSVTRSSGYPALDQAALETARRASPFPPPPAGIAGQPLTASIRFTLRN